MRRVRPTTTAVTIPTTTHTGNMGNASGEKEENSVKVHCDREEKECYSTKRQVIIPSVIIQIMRSEYLSNDRQRAADRKRDAELSISAHTIPLNALRSKQNWAVASPPSTHQQSRHRLKRRHQNLHFLLLLQKWKKPWCCFYEC